MGGTQSAARQLPKQAVSKALSASQLEFTRAHLPAAVGKFNDLVVASGSGSYVVSSSGAAYLDAASGIGVTSTGHCHPRVVAAVREQAAALLFAQQNCTPYHSALTDVVSALHGILPANLDKYLFVNSGSEAVDNAVKVARHATRRQNVIVFDGAFHGRTVAAMSLTTSKAVYRQGMGPLMTGVVTVPYPYCLHCPVRRADSSGRYSYGVAPEGVSPASESAAEPPAPPRTCCNAPLDALEWALKLQSAPEDTAAILVEPILGEGGFLTPPPGFLPALRALCDKHGILLIFDEVQSGAGRTGKWWAHEHFGAVRADMLLYAKGIASGFPFAGLACEGRHMVGMAPGMLGGTYGGSTMGCAAAAATISAITDEGLLANATERGTQLVQGLLRLSERFPIIDVRGLGLMVAVEFEGSSPGVAASVCRSAFEHKMILITAGARESVRFLLPLNVSAAEVDECLAKFTVALKAVFPRPDQSGNTAP